MDQDYTLRYIYKVGSLIKATVTGFDEYGRILLDTATGCKSVLSPTSLEDLTAIPVDFVPTWLPEIGEEIDTVVYNFVDDTLYLSARPSDLFQTTIQSWQDYYDYLDTLEIGQKIEGIVLSRKPFGFMLDLSSPYLGVINMFDCRCNCAPLPEDMSVWPVEGEKIVCLVSGFLFRVKQVSLVWFTSVGNAA
jgi:hypothetical protein